MALSYANICRVLDLIGAPLTLEILDGLGHGVTPENAVPPHTDPAATAEAVEHLRRFGAVEGQFPSTNDDVLSLTQLGLRLFTALDSADRFADPAVTP
jgi:hypothetical protein